MIKLLVAVSARLKNFHFSYEGNCKLIKRCSPAPNVSCAKNNK